MLLHVPPILAHSPYMSFLRPAAALALSLTFLACGADSGSTDRGESSVTTDEQGHDSHGTDRGGTDEEPGSQDDDGSSAHSGDKDAGRSTTSGAKDASGSSRPFAKDAGASKTESRDSGSPGAAPADGPTQTEDTGQPSSGDQAQKDGGDGPMSPDVAPTASDASSSTSGSGTGAPDPSGPCEDLQLFCFDIFDMFIFNPSDCFTCNNGDGCQGCAFPFAY